MKCQLYKKPPKRSDKNPFGKLLSRIPLKDVSIERQGQGADYETHRSVL